MLLQGDQEVTGWVKIEMQLERDARESVLEIDERATSERRVGLEPARLSSTRTLSRPLQYFNTTITRRQYNHDTLYSSTLFTNTANIQTTLLTRLCRKSKAGEASTRESEQPNLIYETRHSHALSGLLSIPHASHATLTTYDLCT